MFESVIEEVQKCKNVILSLDLGKIREEIGRYSIDVKLN
jgi:hypothetical protein